MTSICRRPSWTPETQPNGAVRRRLVEFLVFNSIHWKKSDPPDPENRVITTFYIIIIITELCEYNGLVETKEEAQCAHEAQWWYWWCKRLWLVPVSANGRVEHKKLHKTAAHLSFDWVLVFSSIHEKKKWPVLDGKPWRALCNMLVAPAP